eukprot:4234762-Amphidinium_carterae.1
MMVAISGNLSHKSPDLQVGHFYNPLIGGSIVPTWDGVPLSDLHTRTGRGTGVSYEPLGLGLGLWSPRTLIGYIEP